jgi:hypothetical protein
MRLQVDYLDYAKFGGRLSALLCLAVADGRHDSFRVIGLVSAHGEISEPAHRADSASK